MFRPGGDRREPSKRYDTPEHVIERQAGFGDEHTCIGIEATLVCSARDKHQAVARHSGVAVAAALAAADDCAAIGNGQLLGAGRPAQECLGNGETAPSGDELSAVGSHRFHRGKTRNPSQYSKRGTRHPPRSASAGWSAPDAGAELRLDSREMVATAREKSPEPRLFEGAPEAPTGRFGLYLHVQSFTAK